MFNFNINFLRILRDNLLHDLRTLIRINRIKAMFKPLRVMHAEFLLLKDEFMYKCRFNGAVNYLETALNDRFDPGTAPANRRIFISEFDYDKIYIYKKSELKPPIVLYFRYKPAQAYVVGQFAWMPGNFVYVCNTNCTGKTPGVDPEWTLTTRKAPVIRMASNFNGIISFVVNVPSTLVFDYEEMKALINYYKLAGLGYIIITF